MKLNHVLSHLGFANTMFETFEIKPELTLTLVFSYMACYIVDILYILNLILFALKGSAMPMPPELMELYTLYQQELETSSKNEKETKLISDLNIMMRVKNSIDIN